MLRTNTSTTTSSTSITEQAWHVLPQLIHMKFSLHDTSLGKITMQIVYTFCTVLTEKYFNLTYL